MVSESHYFALGDKECELILACCGKLAELHAGHFGSDAGCELEDLAAFWKEVFEAGVGGFAVLSVDEFL